MTMRCMFEKGCREDMNWLVIAVQCEWSCADGIKVRVQGTGCTQLIAGTKRTKVVVHHSSAQLIEHAVLFHSACSRIHEWNCFPFGPMQIMS